MLCYNISDRAASEMVRARGMIFAAVILLIVAPAALACACGVFDIGNQVVAQELIKTNISYNF